jgi:hypothetical protein
VSKLVPTRSYTHTEVENARTKGQLIGWIQGGVVMFAGLWVLKLIGWVPTLLVVGVAVLLAAKVLFGRKSAG